MPLPEALLKAVFEEAALPLVLLDGRGLLALWNPAFESLFRSIAGAAPERLTSSFFDFVAEREGSRLDYYAAEILLGGKKTQTVDGSIRDPDGKPRWLRYSLSLVEAPNPRPGAAEGRSERFLLCVLEEITDRVLREKRLQDAKDEAEKATHTKSQFLANMSHEIRTPIQTILGVVELLRETDLDTEQLSYVDQVRFSADVLLGLINDILDFSKIEAGRLELETTSFDLRSWVYQSVELLAMEASRKGLEIIVDIDDYLPALVRGDPGRLRQVIVNLFKNAVKFTREGGIVLKARRLPGSGPGPGSSQGRILFEVADTGVGISEEVRSRLFTPFFQGDLAQARKVGGTGLGLAISRHLVEAMGGVIGVRPAQGPGSGSVFWFELPLEAPEYSAPPARPAMPAEAEGARLLVVDDYAEAREHAARLAAAALFRVAAVASGEEALAALREAAAAGDPFAVCLVDQNMPRMDGWRLASEITGDIAINGSRLILMAPLGSIDADAKMKLLRWFNGYLSKPVKSAELLEALGRVLSAEVDLESAESESEPIAKPERRCFVGEVLLAEDHEVNRELFTLLLGKAGCKVVTARDGVEALEIGLSRPFDLVLMDIFMPRMSGYEAVTELRAKGYAGPIVAVTASALKGEREQCIQSGMNDILVKPFKKDELAEMLAKYLPEEGGSEAKAPGASGEGPARAAAGAAEAPDAAVPSSAPKSADDAAVFDWLGVLDTFLGQKGTVSALLSRFIGKAGSQMEELASALAARDGQKFREVSHSLKGASWNLSARKLGDAALAGETAGRQNDMEAAAAALASIRSAYADFVAAASPYASK